MKGRIPKHFIDDLLDRLDIVDVIDSHVPLKKAGANYKACCPFHNEKSPSFTVSQEKQFYHCFGCGAHGTAITFLMEHERLNFPEAIEALAQTAGLEIPYEDFTPGQQQKVNENRKILDLNKSASDIFLKQLRQQPDAINYLKNRGLSGQTAANYNIGYIPDSWDTIITSLGKTDEEKLLLKQAGLISENDSGKQYDKFRHRIMFPIRNRKGDTIAFGGRVITADKEPKYLNSPETPVFHKGRALYGVYEIRKYAKDISYILVVEGYMDVVALAEQGIQTAVATLGTATTTEHIQQLLRMSDKIIFCFDGDKAGKQAAWRALSNSLSALNDTAQLSFLFLPDGEDPDSLVKSEGKEKFEQRFETALPLAEYMFKESAVDIDMSQLAGKAQLANAILPLINQVNAPIMQELLYTRLEDTVHLSREKLLQLAKSEKMQQRQSSSSPKPSTPAQSSNDAPPFPDDIPDMGDGNYEPIDYEQASNSPNSSHRHPIKSQALKMDELTLAISALLAKPELAGEVGNIDLLRKTDDKGINFLCDMLDVIRSTPTLSAQSLLQRYIGTPYEARLSSLQAEFMSVPRTDEVLSKEFLDSIARMEAKSHNLRYQQLINQASLTSEEKQELKQLLERN